MHELNYLLVPCKISCMPVSSLKSKAWLDVTLWCNSNGRGLHLRDLRTLLCNLRCERWNWLRRPGNLHLGSLREPTKPPKVAERSTRDQIERHWSRRVPAITARRQEHLDSTLERTLFGSSHKNPNETLMNQNVIDSGMGAHRKVEQTEKRPILKLED